MTAVSAGDRVPGSDRRHIDRSVLLHRPLLRVGTFRYAVQRKAGLEGRQRDVTERRRIERFAELLDEADGGRRHHRRVDLDPDLAPLVDAARRLVGTLEHPEPTAEFRDRPAGRCSWRTIEREGIGVTAEPRRRSQAARAGGPGRARPRWYDRCAAPGSGRTRVAVIAGVTVGALALSGVSAASTDSIPGDALYSVKRTSEQAQLVLAGSDASRGQLHLEFARSRLVEAARSDPAAATGCARRDGRRGRQPAHGCCSRPPCSAATVRAIDAVDAFVDQQRERS